MSTEENAESAKAVEGWYGPPHATRFHYIGADARSLCGKWFVPAWDAALVDLAFGPARGDCAVCKRMKEARA